ncbi:MAG: co-chaperone GroES [Micrococcales bacterium]|nr:co-chaperone GroES [Micrococcales bacterium]NBT47745.1 co-chaperone GroES [Actinomycetota bacterium]
MKMTERENELAWAFPAVDPGALPLGGRILVQLRRTKKKATSSGIILVEETRETEKWQNMVAKVLAIGPIAFRHRDTMQPWPEGTWCEVGDYIRVPKWGGDRWEVPVPGEDALEDPALFMVLNDHEVIAKLTGDPLSMKAFL